MINVNRIGLLCHGGNYLPLHKPIVLGMLMRAGFDPMRFAHPSNTRAEHQRIVDLAERVVRTPIPMICAQILEIHGVDAPYCKDECVQRAMSTADAGAIFTSVSQAALLAGFDDGNSSDSSEGWVTEVDIPNHRLQERRALDVGGLAKVPRGGTAQNVEVDAGLTEDYKAARFARSFTVDEMDLIDDNIEALTQIPHEMGLAARELRNDLVCSILLNNDALQTDSVALFHADHNNLDSGGASALNETSLGLGIQRIAAQRILDRALNLQARYLIVPSALKVKAQALLRTLERRDASDHLVLRTDDRLGVAGVKDPFTNQLVLGTATNWYLATTHRRTVEIGFVKGTGRVPVLRETILGANKKTSVENIGRWGIDFDVKYDLGGKAVDYRGMYKAAGT